MRARRLIAITCAACAVMTATAHAAAPPTVAQVAAALGSARTYVDPAAGIKQANVERLATGAKAFPADMHLAIVSGLAAGEKSANSEAAAIRAKLGPGTMLLATPKGLGIASTTASADDIAAARTAAKGKGAVDALLAAGAALTPAAPPGTTQTSTATTPASTSSSSGISPWVYVAIALGAVVLLLVLLRMRARRAHHHGARAGRGSGLVDAARANASSRAAELGRALAESAMAVSERDDPTIAEHHRQAGDLVAEVRRELPGLDGPPAFRRAHESLDVAEWHLGVAEAHVLGTAEPPMPASGKPARCFFDARHGLASVEVELELPGIRTVTVGVCAACAVKLGRGEQPDVGTVAVGRRTVAWAAAPTWFGGWGWGEDDLPALQYQGHNVFPSTGLPAPAPLFDDHDHDHQHDDAGSHDHEHSHAEHHHEHDHGDASGHGEASHADDTVDEPQVVFDDDFTLGTTETPPPEDADQR